MTKKREKPRFDIYPLFSRLDFWLAVIFIVVLLGLIVFMFLPAPEVA